MTTTFTIRRLSKSFFGNPVLRELELDMVPGEILGLVGANGAGKSTLMNILGGHLQTDAGEMLLDGQVYRPRSSREATARGVGQVHQELNLFPNLTIAENLFLHGPPHSMGWIHRRRRDRLAQACLQRVGLDIVVSTPVAKLSAGQQQLVELSRVLASDCRVLLLDEPTTSLSDRETGRFFQLVRELADSGKSIILITHAINDVLEHCDRVAILRDGALVENIATNLIDAQGVIQRMIGRSLEPGAGEPRLMKERVSSMEQPSQPERDASPGRLDHPEPNSVRFDDLLRVENVSQPRIVSNISFEVRSGETVGIFGLMGAGRSELARILMGLDPCQGGSITMNGRKLTGGPRSRIGRGLGMVTEDRRRDGILANASLSDNFSLVSLKKFTGRWLGWIQEKPLRATIESMRSSVYLQNRLRKDQPMRTLSGGNQQKVILGKWLIENSRVLILDEPTRGIDVGARFEIYRLIRRYAGQGNGALVISSDLDELLGICNRILVMSLGKVTAEFKRSEFDHARILEAAFREHQRATTKEVAS